MRYKKIILASLFCFVVYFTPSSIFSDNIKQADKYYETYDYKLALAIYEKEMLKNPGLEIAQKLANCYRFINDSEGAEKAYSHVLGFNGADAINYKFYADALKQNGRFELAKLNYIKYGLQLPDSINDANRLANSTDVAKMWTANPVEGTEVKNLRALNSEYSEFSPVIYKNDLIFTSDRWFVTSSDERKKEGIYGWTGNPFLKLYRASQSGDNFKIDLMTGLNQTYHTGLATFSSSGDTVYFTLTSNPSKEKSRAPLKKRIYMAHLTTEGWSEPKSISLNTDDYSIQHPSISPDGTILYFASDMPGGYGKMDIYASKKLINGEWGAAVNCGSNVNSAEDDVFPVIKQDGQLLFSSKGHIGMGGLDIYTSRGDFDNFEIAQNLKAPINSPRDDFGVVFKNETEGYLSSNRAGGKGLDDIYSFVLNNKKQQLYYAIEGQVLDKISGEILSNVEVILLNKSTNKKQSVYSDTFGKFYFDLEPEMDYSISGNQALYYSKQEGSISTRGLKESTVFKVNFELERVKGDSYVVKLSNIYYNFDKWDIRPDAATELNKVAVFMTNRPNINVELRSHTDSRGKAVYNQWLSQKRAESAVNYLLEKGVENTRLAANGLGETELLNECRDGVACSKRAHQLNRRTEFKVVKVSPLLSISTLATAGRK